MGKYIEVPSRVLAGILLLLSSLVGVHVFEYNQRTYVPTTVLVERAVKSVVVIECYSPTGRAGEFGVSTTAGFVASDNGHIFTVAHGLTECTKRKQKYLRVRFWNNPSVPYRAAILRMDTVLDAAILQVPNAPKDIEPLDVDLSIQPQGSHVIAIGHPQLLYWSISDGMVSSDRLWTNPLRHLIQVSAPIIPGNSGGPILNDEGYVIGVASFYLDGSSTLGFIVPMDTFTQIARGIHF